MPAPDVPSPTLAQILTLSPATGADGSPLVDHYVGHSPPERRARVFGGQVVAQSLVAATATVPQSHLIHSLHAYSSTVTADGSPPSPRRSSRAPQPG